MSRNQFEELSMKRSTSSQQRRAATLTSFLDREHLTDGYGPDWVIALSIDCERAEEYATTSLLRRGDGSSERLVFQPGDLSRLCRDRSLVVDASLDGLSVKAQRWNRVSFARDSRGALFTYSLTPHVVSRERVLVEESCNHMPSSPRPESVGILVTRTFELPRRHFEWSYDVEELEMICTQNLY